MKKSICALFIFCVCLMIAAITKAGLEGTFAIQEKSAVVTLDEIKGWSEPESYPDKDGNEIWQFTATNNGNIFIYARVYEDQPGQYRATYELVEQYLLPANSNAFSQVFSITNDGAVLNPRRIMRGILKQSWATHEICWTATPIKSEQPKPILPPIQIMEWKNNTNIANSITIIYLIRDNEVVIKQ